MLIPTPRFLALPLIALAVIAALGIKGHPVVAADDPAPAAPVLQQLANAAKTTLVR